MPTRGRRSRPSPNRAPLILAAVLLLSAAAGVLVWRSLHPAALKPLDRVSKEGPLRIEISHAGKAMTLRREAGLWRMTAPVEDLADGNACRYLADALSHLTIGSDLSDAPSSYADFGLSETSAIRARVFAGEGAPLFDGYFGKTALDFDTAYLRLAGGKSVYAESGVGPHHLDRSPDDYRERAIVPRDSVAIERIALTAGRKLYEFHKSSQGLSPTKGFLAPEKILAFFDALTAVRVAQFVSRPPDPYETGLDRPVLTIEASGGGLSIEWRIGKERKEPRGGKPLYRWVEARGGRSLTGLVSAAEAESLIKLLR